MYPIDSDQYPYLKEEFGYQFDARQYANEEIVIVNIDDSWYQSYIEMALTYEGIPYFSIPDFDFRTNQMRDSQFTIPEGAVFIQVEDTE